MRHNLTVMFVLMVLTAVAQDMFPPLYPAGGKLPWMSGVVIYYALSRERVWGITAAVWAGLLQDALAGLPMGTSVAGFGLLLFLLGRWRRLAPVDFALAAAMTAALAAPLLTAWQYGVLRMTGNYVALGWGTLLLRLLTAVPSGIVAATSLYVLSAGLDRAMGNVKRRKDIDALDGASFA